MNFLLYALIWALICTITIEYGVFLVLIREKPGLLFFYTILINGITNPLLNYLFLFHCPVLWLLEAVVILIESILLHLLTGIGWRKAVVCSVCANCASIIIEKFCFP